MKPCLFSAFSKEVASLLGMLSVNATKRSLKQLGPHAIMRRRISTAGKLNSCWLGLICIEQKDVGWNAPEHVRLRNVKSRVRPLMDSERANVKRWRRMINRMRRTTARSLQLRIEIEFGDPSARSCVAQISQPAAYSRGMAFKP
jgi:hypothetical protein